MRRAPTGPFAFAISRRDGYVPANPNCRARSRMVLTASPRSIGSSLFFFRNARHCAIPELEQQRALEQEVRCVLGDGQPVQQAFQAVLGQRQIEIPLDLSVCCLSRARMDAARLAVTGAPSCCALRYEPLGRPGGLMP